MVPIGHPLIALMRAIINSPGAKESRAKLPQSAADPQQIPV